MNRAELLQKMHAYWRAANYLSVGQIYLLIDHKAYVRKHGQDMPEVRNWRWSSPGASSGAR